MMKRLVKANENWVCFSMLMDVKVGFQLLNLTLNIYCNVVSILKSVHIIIKITTIIIRLIFVLNFSLEAIFLDRLLLCRPALWLLKPHTDMSRYILQTSSMLLSFR